jgi:hypothetical protein
MEIYHCNNKQESGKIECFLFLYLEWFFLLFNPHIKPKIMKLVFVASQLSTTLRRKSKDWLAENHDNVS